MENSATIDDVREAYLRAWKTECKGITVYRDGCRDGVLVNENNISNRQTNTIIKTTAPKRPKELLCDIHHAKITKKLDKNRTFEYAILVGLLNNDPYEIFVFENGHLDKKYNKAKLIKMSRGHYNLILDDKIVENIMNDQTEEEEMITRLASTALRHGADIAFLVHQLEKVKGSNIGSFTKVMARILKKYIKDGTKVSGEICSSCGSSNIIRKEGCMLCVDCGNSKCG
jgi:ribonucleoside-diphosphate reductase alpha chain